MQMAAQKLDWLDELNPEQRGAVTHGEGPILVVAGAGSGKTRTLAYRVAYLITQGVDPSRILLLTFTRRGADEMLRRASAIAQRSAADTGDVWGGTFHGAANRLLRIYAKAAGLDNDFTIMDQADSADMVNVIRHEMDLSSKKKRFPRKMTCLEIYSRCVNSGEAVDRVLAQHYPWCRDWEAELKALFKTFTARKQEFNVLDYDDLLLYWRALLETEEIADDMGGRFDHVLVDEYQDTNPVQAAILRGLRRSNCNIMAVGDDAQSIYGFRAATVRNMLDFPSQFDNTTIIKLEQNYRSVPPILETTNRVIRQSKERFSKELWSTRSEGQRPRIVTCRDESRQDAYIVERVLEHYEQGIPLRKQAVLFRASHHSDSLEVLLTRRNIPYHKYGGLRFLEAAHIKDLIAFLRILENPRDEMAWFRILQLFDDIGPATAQRAIGHVRENRDDPASIGSFKAPPAAAESINGLGQLIQALGADDLNPASQIERIRAFYHPILEKTYENPVVRESDIEHLEQIATGYRSRKSFLSELTLDPPTSTSDLAGPPEKDEDWLVLSTIHSAKGCEWDVVYLIHAADGCLPSDMSTGSEEELDEELRLTYVALTRARDFLYVTWPLRYYHAWSKFTDKHVYAQMCRFLTDDVCESVDRIDLTDRLQEDAATTLRPSSDIKKSLRSMWE